MISTPSGNAEYGRNQPLDQLIIIGNGFDRECMLESNYKDFFRSNWRGTSRYESVQKIISMESGDELLIPSSDARKDYRDVVDKAGLTIWDIILLEHEDKYWYGIEKAIEDYVVPEVWEKRGAAPTYRLGSTTWAMHGLRSGTNDDPMARQSLCKDSIRCAEFILNTIESSHLPSSNDGSLHHYLLLQLEELEQAFLDYLRALTEDNKQYEELSRQLIGDLLSAGPRLVPGTAGGAVLSFNYTQPSVPDEYRNPDGESQVPFVNVHGNLDIGTVVFGIDETSCKGRKNASGFAKGSRAVSLNLPNLGSQVGDKALRKGNDSVSCIKFYGHSLARADYSYFWWIFDEVRLPDGDTRLAFYFRPTRDGKGGRKDIDEARASLQMSVEDLLRTYYKSIMHEHRGVDLVKKLQCEGRLSIQLLGDPSDWA